MQWDLVRLGLRTIGLDLSDGMLAEARNGVRATMCRPTCACCPLPIRVPTACGSARRSCTCRTPTRTRPCANFIACSNRLGRCISASRAARANASAIHSTACRAILFTGRRLNATENYTEDELEPLLQGFTATIMAGGHTHIPMVRRYREITVVNPGSVGMAWERTGGTVVRLWRWAEYAVLSCDDDKFRIELRRVPLNMDEVRRAAFASGMPRAAWWVAQWG